MAVPRDGDSRSIWVMLGPSHPPLYKQTPAGNFWLTDEQIRALVAQQRITSTVEQALRSHVRWR
jgi:hypothetical protein